MTISFRCPHCDALCAFMDKYAGRRAKCTTCQKKFIIPSQSDVKPEKVTEKIKVIEKTTPGFYKAVFIESWAAIFYPETLSTIKYLVMLVVLKLVLGGATVIWASTIRPPTGFDIFFVLIQVAILGFLAFALFCALGRTIELYMDVVADTGFEIDQLPPPLSDSDFPIWQHMLKPFLIFFGMILVAFMPYFLGDMFFMHAGIEHGSIFAVHKDLTIILQALWLISVFSIPSIFIHIAISRDWMCLRPDFVFKPMLKAPMPYFLLVLMFIAVFYIESSTDISNSLMAGDMPSVILKSILNILALVPILWVMRSSGLFYRHYACYFKL